jgi:hypothetical protein
MKKLIFALTLVMVSSSAFADQSWTVKSKGANPSPITSEAITAQVQKAIDSYKTLNAEVGALESWTCTVKKVTSPPARNYIDTCSAILDLPSDWDYYGSFKLDVGFDPYNNSTITSLNYQWINQ